MGHYFKYLGSKESAKALWENQEALDKYLNRLWELMMADPKSRMYEGETADEAAYRARVYNEAVKRGLA